MSALAIFETIAAMREGSRGARSRGTLGLVPTMGALHEGHLSLVRAARERCGAVAVSIFVNPTQFGPSEDFSRYPRTLERDMELLEREGVTMVFAPSVEEMYPSGAGTFVEVPGLSERLDGHFRPGHFRGVATVVAKLFHIVTPDLAYFGQKDAAQVAVLRAMVRDLGFPVEMVVCPTVREQDGLAMSSRNQYLSASERGRALVIHRALCAAERMAHSGELDAIALERAMREVLAEEPAVAVEYVAVVHPETLLPVEDLTRGALLAIAARVGVTRLIDNVLLPAMPVSL